MMHQKHRLIQFRSKVHRDGYVAFGGKRRPPEWLIKRGGAAGCAADDEKRIGKVS